MGGGERACLRGEDVRRSEAVLGIHQGSRSDRCWWRQDRADPGRGNRQREVAGRPGVCEYLEGMKRGFKEDFCQD